MKKFNPTKILFGFLGLATFASLVGSVSGSLAWYAYSARASMSYTGTSIERTSQLQVGVVSPNAIDYTEAEMVEDTSITDLDDNHYYFAPIGAGLTSSILEKYLNANGYATNYLVPATTGSYDIGDAFNLRMAPSLDTGYINNDIEALTPKHHYAYFKFVFRVAKNAYSATSEYLPNHEIWLSDAQAKASSSGQGDVFKALRIYIDRKEGYGNDYVFNPGASAAGETKVGGLLDLGGDGMYDYDADSNEIIYGEYDQSIADSKRTVNYQGADEIDDVNESGATSLDSFTAKHGMGKNYYTKESLAECGIKTAKYLSLSDIAPVRNSSTGELENPEGKVTSLCKTDENDHNIARVDMTVYLEGWDFSVVDSEEGHLFDIGLTFEINKVAAND